MKLKKKFLMVFVVAGMVLSMGTSTFASTNEEVTAMADLTTGVHDDLSGRSYSLAEGGSIQGKELFEENPNYDTTGNPVYTINEDTFNELSSAAQSEFVSDIVEQSNVVDKEKENVSESTVQLWWKELQTKEGVGSKFMTEILKNTKPDFVSANRIYSPFSGVIGTALGLGCVLICALLGLSMVCDIAYITIPPIQAFGGDGNGGNNGRSFKSFIFSASAKNAVKEAEQSMNGNGGWKQPLGIYFKHQAIQLIVLGICLLYLVSGQLYTLVGWILDLLRGFLHF